MNSYRGVLNDFITSQVIDFFARLKSTSSALLHFCLGRNVPIAVIGITSVGDAGNAADRVRSQRYRVEGLDGDFLCYLYGIIDLDPEVPHSAFDFRMSERELCGSQIPGSAVGQHHLRSPQLVRAEHRRIKLDAGNRLSDKPAVPTRRQSSFVAATGEEELTQHPSRQSQTIRERRLYEGEASVPAIASPDSFYFNAIS